MTFEEFFKKKRIDLTLLQTDKPDLYEEFRQHYAQMGEKSFDHTKKYWFNRLRKEFLLKIVELPKEMPKAAPAEVQTVIAAGSAVSGKPTGFKPRFKASAVKPIKPAADTSQVAPPEEIAPKKPEAPNVPGPSRKGTTPALGFKPRFKAGQATAKAPGSNKEETKAPHSEGSTPATEPPVTESPAESTSKPLGFKPRFKAGKTTPKKDNTE